MSAADQDSCPLCGWVIPVRMPPELRPIALMDHRYYACSQQARAEESTGV